MVAHVHGDPEWATKMGLAGQQYARSALDLDSARARIDRLVEVTLQGRAREAPKAVPVRDPNRFELLGIRINAAPFDRVLERVLHAPESGERLSLHFATAHTLVESQEDAGLRDARCKGLVQPDGMPLVLPRAGGRVPRGARLRSRLHAGADRGGI